jgi:hypothetical protein
MGPDQTTIEPEQQQTDPGSWKSAGAAAVSSPPAPSTPGTVASPNGNAPAQPAAATAPKAAQDTEDQVGAVPALPDQSKVPPVVMRPARGGLLGVVDKFTDAMTGQTRPEIWKDDAGNEYIRHPQMTRGQQWMRIGGELMEGAAAGLAAGRGAGHMGNAALAGVQVAQQNQQQAEAQEDKMKTEVQQDRIDRANAFKTHMDLIEQAFRAKRLGVEATQKDALFSQNMIEDLKKNYDGTVLGTAPDLNGLANLMQSTPDFANNMIKAGTVQPINTVDANGNHEITFMQIPRDQLDKMLPPKSPFNVFNPTTHQLEEQQSSNAMTKRQQLTYNADADKAKLDWQTKQAELENKKASTEHLQTENQQLKDMAPLKLDELKQNIKKSVAETALAWTNNRKSKIEADNALNNAIGDDVESNAQALVDQRSTSSLMSKRKDYNAIMRRADELSKAQTGKPYDREAGEIGYKSRLKLTEEYTGTGGEAKNLESFDKFFGHALNASQAVNTLRNQNVKLVNMPLNKLATLAGTNRSNAVVGALVDIENMRTEYESMLKNNTALTVEDRKNGETILSENATPAQMQEAMSRMVHAGVVRVRASDYTFSRTMGQHVPMLISPDGQRALQHFGIDPNEVYSDNVGISMQAPDGTISKVPKDKVQGYQKLGAKVVEP